MHSPAKYKEEIQMATVYRVSKDPTSPFGMYRVAKVVIDHELEVYHVTYKVGEGGGEGDAKLFCDCPGFLRQKYAPEQHKHIRAVRDYISRGSPEYAEYNFKGGGQETTIRFIRAKQ